MGRIQRHTALFALLLLALALFSAPLPAPKAARTANAALQGQAGTEKLIALTFDDGPRRATTARLLDGLAQRGVRATCFLLGEQLAYNEDIIRRMDAEGHQIGIHTYDHVRLTGLSRADFDAQVEKTRAQLYGILGHNSFLLRPPYGALDESVRQWAGCPIILWSVDPEDWADHDAGRIADHLAANARDGSILLLHDIYPESVDAALAAVDRLHSEGYFFCTVEELFAARGIPLEGGKVYRSAYP